MFSYCYSVVQWNLSIVNSHGTQKNVHYTEVFTQEGWDMFMYTCACNTLKTVPSLLVRSSLGGRAIFQTVFLSFYILWFFWIFYESTCISYRLDSLPFFIHPLTQTRCAHYDCNLQTEWNLAISLKHYSDDWETNKTLSTWYSVKFMGMWDP